MKPTAVPDNTCAKKPRPAACAGRTPADFPEILLRAIPPLAEMH